LLLVLTVIQTFFFASYSCFKAPKQNWLLLDLCAWICHHNQVLFAYSSWTHSFHSNMKSKIDIRLMFIWSYCVKTTKDFFVSSKKKGFFV
jgi:hypothetical protein